MKKNEKKKNETLVSLSENPPVSFDRLQAMIAAQASGESMSEEMQKEILDALIYLWSYLHANERAHMRGRLPVYELWLEANMVRVLVDEYGASVKSAIIAVIPAAPGNDKESLRIFDLNYARVYGAYYDLKNGDGIKWMVRPEELAEAVKKLRAAQKKCETNAPICFTKYNE